MLSTAFALVMGFDGELLMLKVKTGLTDNERAVPMAGKDTTIGDLEEHQGRGNGALLWHHATNEHQAPSSWGL